MAMDGRTTDESTMMSTTHKPSHIHLGEEKCKPQHTCLSYLSVRHSTHSVSFCFTALYLVISSP